MIKKHQPTNDGRSADQGSFRTWFGESVVTETGKPGGIPLVVYHGTSGDFNAFLPNQRGIFFAESPEAAAPFSRIRNGQPNIIPAYVSIKNPWTMIRYGDDVPFSRMEDQSVAALKAKGYDGTYSPDDGVWVAFSPMQIKSAVGNRGTFDPNDPNICH